MIRNLVLTLLALCISSDILVWAVKQNPDLIFNGGLKNGKVVLALSKKFVLQTDKSSIFTLPDATEATVTGTDTSLVIAYNDIPSDDSKAKLSNAKLKFDITEASGAATGYWTLDALTVTYNTTKEVKFDVGSNPGATKQPADQICDRGHLTCAPKNLCWACDNQIFKKGDVRLTMPGARLQPVFGTVPAAFKFGYEWDCDPLIPLSVWVGILLTLTLVTFLYWAIDMLVSLQTPNRFDDPRGKPLNVPTSD